MTRSADTKEGGFTPGPWELEDDDWGHRIVMGDAITSPYDHKTHNLIKYEHGCTPEECPGQYAQALANARLIAAAPDLLEALQHLRRAAEINATSSMSAGERSLWNANAEHARAALAKALPPTGEGR